MGDQDADAYYDQACHRGLKQHRGGFRLVAREWAVLDRQTLLALGRSDGTSMKGSLQIRNRPLPPPIWSTVGAVTAPSVHRYGRGRPSSISPSLRPRIQRTLRWQLAIAVPNVKYSYKPNYVSKRRPCLTGKVQTSKERPLRAIARPVVLHTRTLWRRSIWLIRSQRPTPGRQPARQRRAKCQAPRELRNERRDDGHHRSEHEYEDRKDRGCQQLGIAATSQRQNP